MLKKYCNCKKSMVYYVRKEDNNLRLYSYHTAEHAAVNRRVVGSSPTGGAKKSTSTVCACRFLLITYSLFLK